MQRMKIAVIGPEQDADAWNAAGRRLREVDPRRFADLLELAQRMVAAHDDPVAAARADRLAVSRLPLLRSDDVSSDA